MHKKIKDTELYFESVLENINIILSNSFYKNEDKENLKLVKSKLENWYKIYKEENTLKSIGSKELENIELEITDFFDKYVAVESVKENYAERLSYDFGCLEIRWKKEMLEGSTNNRWCFK